MGSPLTVELAEIRVTELEAIALNTSPQPPSLYKHFVDDGFGVLCDKTHGETYLEYVNSLSSDLQSCLIFMRTIARKRLVLFY